MKLITFLIRYAGRVAQLVERQSNKLPVEGSSPFVTIFCINSSTLTSKRGQEGIEPSTSPTLKENHTTRPLARTLI